ncbi:hypothetical protein [Crateriforma conspicua]|uniref:hypothetical protein n=1 Tax=Crateriforma conspicua TaxID=2527996 RepID=UPI0013FCFC70|nr:hypothetical protein [Crateriforma conspicua]
MRSMFKTKRLLPIAAIGGILAFIAGQFFSINVGVNQSETSVVSPDAEPSDETSVDAPAMVQSGGESSMIEDAKLWLIDVLIDGTDYSVQRVTESNVGDDSPARQSMSLDQIVQAAGQAEGDASGTRVRISRTPEAVASAEKKLTTALHDAGIADDAVETRQRLVEDKSTNGDPVRATEG